MASTSSAHGAVGAPSVGPFRMKGIVCEDHCGDMYGCEFCPFSTEQDILAAVGKNRVSVFECPPANERRPAIRALQEYADPAVAQSAEAYFCCCWLYDDEVLMQPYLAAAGERGIIRIIDPFAHDCVAVCYGHGGSVNELKVHPCYTTLFFSASKDYSVRVWHSLTQQCLMVFAGDECHRDQVISIDVHHSGAALLSGSMDHALHVWPVDEQLLRRRHRHARMLLSGSAADAKCDDAPSQGTDNVKAESESVDATPPPPAKRWRSAHGNRSKAEMSPEVVSYTLAKTRDIHHDYVDCVAFVGDLVVSKSCGGAIVACKFGSWSSPAADALLVADASRRPTQMRVAETEVNVVCEFDLDNSALWFEKFTVDAKCRWLACGNDVGEVSVWDLRELSANWELCKLPSYTLTTGQRKPVRHLSFNRHSTILVAACDCGVLVRWDVADK